MTRRDDSREVIARAYRDEWGRVTATLIRHTGDWSLAEECAAEAFTRAIERWPDDGIPRNPGAWLTTVAKRLAIDRLRRQAVESHKVREAATMTEVEGGRSVGRRAGVPLPASASDPSDDAHSVGDSGEAVWSDAADDGVDDRLRLIFTCCHPALALEARVALTLRILGGLDTGEIARAFLVEERTMAQRIVRAKARIRSAGIPYRVPPPSALTERVGGVLAVLYLVFNAGYSASGGDAARRGALADEAIRLTRMLVRLMPDEPEARALLALMLLQDSRRLARLDGDGEVVTLDRQDRTRWDRAQIAMGIDLLGGPDCTHDPEQIREIDAARSARGRYRIQAEIAALHATAPTPEATDFARITERYKELIEIDPSPVIALNHALAIGFAGHVEAGLDELARLEASGVLDRYHLLPAAQAELLARSGRTDDATARLRDALALAPSEAERRSLKRRLDELAAS